MKNTRIRYTCADDIRHQCPQGELVHEEPKKRFWCQTLTQRCAVTKRIDVVVKQAIAASRAVETHDAFSMDVILPDEK